MNKSSHSSNINLSIFMIICLSFIIKSCVVITPMLPLVVLLWTSFVLVALFTSLLDDDVFSLSPLPSSIKEGVFLVLAIGVIGVSYCISLSCKECDVYDIHQWLLC